MMKGTKAVAGMNIKRLMFGICVAFVLLGAFVCVASARTIYVPDDYAKIQWAVDNATAGDTIVVRDGTYVENIDINKPHLTIKSENGSANCVVQAANPKDHVFYVIADNVNIKGLTVTGATGYVKAGIYLYNSNNSRIENVIASNNCYGIYLPYSSNNTIANNNISSNNYYGIYLDESRNNTIANNIVSTNNKYYGNGIRLRDSSSNNIANNIVSSNEYGIYLYFSSNNTIANNTALNNIYGIYLDESRNNTIANNIVSNNGDGIYLQDSSNNNIISNNNISSNIGDGIYLYFHSSSNNIANNIVSNNDYGIYLLYSRNNTIANNIVSTNNGDGISLSHSSSNNIANNIVSDNYGGIILCWSSGNTISNNNISSNNYHGIYLGYSGGNTISNNNISSNIGDGIHFYHSSGDIIYLNNFINNTDNVYSFCSTNIWNSTSKITYTYNGKTYTNYLGNYWSDYTGSDADGDGIGDTPYSIDEDRDNYPLMKRFENYIVTPVPNQPPIANFTYSPEKPVVNQSVTFDASSSYDPDGNITNYEWDFGDGNITNTTEEKIKHSYSEAGSYKVTLTVKDDKGATNSTTKMVTVQLAQPSVSISTDKYEYTAGDIMLINITITNPSERKGVKFLFCLDILDYDKHFTIINNRSLLLSPHYDKTFTLRWKLPELKSSFNASWHVAIFNATTSELISEDHADWKYVTAKAKKTNVKELEKSVREIEIPF